MVTTQKQWWSLPHTSNCYKNNTPYQSGIDDGRDVGTLVHCTSQNVIGSQRNNWKRGEKFFSQASVEIPEKQFTLNSHYRINHPTCTLQGQLKYDTTFSFYFNFTLSLPPFATPQQNPAHFWVERASVLGLPVDLPDDIENGFLHMQQHVLYARHVPAQKQSTHSCLIQCLA